MNNLRIAIYTPAKNESKHATAWAESCADADYRIVIDTGSSDDTKHLLETAGVDVYNVRVIPWRFDDAYNIAMSLVPEDADVLICLHMDERLDAGWRQLIETHWQSNTTRLRYTYIWNWNQDGTPGRVWSGDRIHARAGFRWVGCTHEGLVSRLPEVQTVCNDLKILHYPDPKTKDSDLKLLIESAKDWPHDARIKAYLGREYMYKGHIELATATYKEFLVMSQDKIERGQAMMNLAQTDPDNKIYWLNSAKIELPFHREPLVSLAQHYYEIGDWTNCYKNATAALEIVDHPMDYTCTPEAWGSQPHDLLSIAAWNVGLYFESHEQAKLAVLKQPKDDRLINNLRIVETFLESNGMHNFVKKS